MKLLNKFVIEHQIEYLSSTNKMYLSCLIFCVLHEAGMKQNSYNKQSTQKEVLLVGKNKTFNSFSIMYYQKHASTSHAVAFR